MPLASVSTFGHSDALATYDRARLLRIPPGVAGTRATLRLIEREVQKGKKHPVAAELAEYVMNRFGARPHDQRSQIRAVYRALREGLFYTGDIRQVETLRDGAKLAAKMLRYFKGRGPKPLADCDDYTIAGRELLEFVGFPTKSRAIGTRARGRYNHVYPMARLKTGEWVAVEGTTKVSRPFWAPRSTTIRPMDVPALSGLAQAEEPTFIEKAAVRVFKEVLPTTMEQTMRPVVEQLRDEVKFLRYLFLGMTLATVAAAWRLFQKPRVRRAA